MLIGLIALGLVVEYLGDPNRDTTNKVTYTLDGMRYGNYRIDGLNRGTVYQHGMLGNVETNLMTRLDPMPERREYRLCFARALERMPDRDYTPKVKTSHGRDQFSAEGSPDNRLIDANYESHGGKIDLQLAEFDLQYHDLTPYVREALRVLLSSGNVDEGVIISIIHDKMIDDFWSDNLPTEVILPETKQRSKDGSLTRDDVARGQAISEYFVWLEKLATKVARIAYLYV